MYVRYPLVAAVCIATMLPTAVHAQSSILGAEALQAAGAAQAPLPPDTLGGSLLLGMIGEDIYATLNLRLSFDREMWGVGLGLPIRFRLIDRGAENDPTEESGVFRKEDWDDPADWLKIIRYVYVGRRDKKGPFYVRIGELTGLTMGHGTIVNRYRNGFDIDTWRIGTNVAINYGAFGGEIAIGDVARLGSPVMIGGRVTVRPLSLAFGQTRTATTADNPEGKVERSWAAGLYDKFVVGFSLISDPDAPFELATNPDGTLILDDEDTPMATRERALVIVGLDFGVELLTTSLLTIEPYMDINKMSVVDDGWGFHLGVLWKARLPLLIDTLTVDLRTEYRRVSHDYVGPYFDTLYELERRTRLVEGVSLARSSKLRLLQEQGGGGRNGVYFDIIAGLPNWAYIGGEYVDYDGGIADGTLRLSLNVPALEVVKFSAFYYRVNIEGVSDLFALDEKSVLVAEASVPIYSVFTINARWWRVWENTPDGLQSIDDWSIGVGFSLEL